VLEGIEGRVKEIRESEVVVQVGGLFFKLNCTPNTIGKLAREKEFYFLTFMAYSQDRPPELYGFIDNEEKELFNILLKASKIGPKSAMKILSSASPSRIKHIISSKNVAELSSLPGIGKKTAERMIVEIASLIDTSEIESGDEVPAVQRSHGEEAMVALTSLGFDESQARKVVVKILKENKEIDTQELLKKALKEIRK
jgi:Holliday junction DNA helicase RuvA